MPAVERQPPDAMRGGTTLGILAGGAATRLGGAAKAWLQRDGEAQVLRIARRLGPSVRSVLVSANSGFDRYTRHGLRAVADSITNLGPLGGLHALAGACDTHWLMTVPVDVVDINDCLLATLAAHAGPSGASAIDDDGPQPLVALWPVAALQAASRSAMARRDYAIHALQRALDMSAVRLPGIRFGNLNTPADLIAANVSPGDG